MHREAKGTFDTFERAGTEPADPELSTRPSPAGHRTKEKLGRGRSGAERAGAGAPRPPGGLSELGCDGKTFTATATAAKCLLCPLGVEEAGLSLLP